MTSRSNTILSVILGIIIFIIIIIGVSWLLSRNSTETTSMESTQNEQDTNATDESLEQSSQDQSNGEGQTGEENREQTLIEQIQNTPLYNRVILKTSKGDITLELYHEDAPFTVRSFLYLAGAGYYDGIKFHRVIKDFMIQTGDPNSKQPNKAAWGKGGPGYTFADEINDRKLTEGSLAMANAGPNTNGSQFFIVTAEETPWLDGKHTNFGQVVDGIDVVMEIDNTETQTGDYPVEDISILSIELIDPVVETPAEQEPETTPNTEEATTTDDTIEEVQPTP